MTIADGTVSTQFKMLGYILGSTTITAAYQGMGQFTENTNYIFLNYIDANSIITPVSLGMFSNGTRSLYAGFEFNAVDN